MLLCKGKENSEDKKDLSQTPLFQPVLTAKDSTIATSNQQKTHISESKFCIE